MNSLSLGDLIIVDRGHLGVDIVNKRGKKMQVFFDNKGADALRKWLRKRKKELEAS